NTGLFVLEITPFPGLDKIRPGSRIEDIHLGRLSLVSGTIGNALEWQSCGITTIAWYGSHQDTPFGGICILSRDLYFVVLYFGIYKIAGELLRRWSGLDYGSWQTHGILHHELDHTILVAFYIPGNFDGLGLI